MAENEVPKRRRWLRISLIVAGVVVLAVGGLYAFIVLVFPPSQLAVLLANEVKAATGRDFRIDGGLTIRVLPTVAVRARDVVLGNAEWSSRPEMVSVRDAAFELSPRALLSGEVRILRIRLEGVDAQLETDGADRANWQFQRQGAPAAPQPTQPASARENSQSTAISLDRLTAADVRVTYRSGKDGAPITLNIQSLNLEAKNNGNAVAMQFTAGQQRWQLEGEVGSSAVLLEGQQDFPFDLRLSTDGARSAIKGTLGTGSRAGTVTADVTATVSTAAALAALGASASSVPVPLELSTSLRYGQQQLQAGAIRLKAAGQSISGRATLSTAQPRLRLNAELSATTFDVSKLQAVKANKSARQTDKAKEPLFADTPLPLPKAPGFDLNLLVAIDHLTIPDAPPLSALRAKLTLARDKMSIDELRFGVAGGSATGRASMSTAADTTPRITVAFDAKSLSMETLDAAAGGDKHLRGGRAALSANLSMSGSTPKRLAASADGDILLSAADVVLTGGSVALDRSVVRTVFGLLVPKGSSDREMTVQCAVARLPLRRGVAAIDRSIALETREAAVVASGDINLVDQTLRLEFRPTVKKGLGLSAATLSELMMVSGPLHDPTVGIDPKGALRGATNAGVAVATGGLSLLVPRATGSAKDASACNLAAAAARPAGEAPAAKDKSRGFLGIR